MAKLETKLTQETIDTWALAMIGSVDQENYLLLSTIESRAILTRLAEVQTRRLIIDLAATEQFDSLGLQLLLLLYKQLNERNIQVILRNPKAHLRQMLRIMQFDQIFKVISNDYTTPAGNGQRLCL